MSDPDSGSELREPHAEEADTASAASPIATLAVMGLRRWWRSRMPWLWTALVAAFIWYDWAVGDPGAGSGSWTMWLSAGCLFGFLAGYDAFIDPRRKGYLGTILLQPVSRAAVVLGAFAASGTIALCGLFVLLLYLIAFGAPPPAGGVAVAIPLGVAGTLGFLAYAEAGSLVLGRDAAAVLGLLVLALGSMPVHRFLPAGTPGWVGQGVEGIFLALPSSHRLGEIAAMTDGSAWRAVLVGTQIAAALALAYLLLGRSALLRLSADEDT